MPLIVDEKGNPIWVPDAPAAAAAPPAALTGQVVTMIDDIGVPRAVDLAEVAGKEAANWRLETPEESAAREYEAKYGGVEGEAYKAFQQFTRGASGGLSDPIITGAFEAAGRPELAEEFRTEGREIQEREGALGQAFEIAGSFVNPVSRLSVPLKGARAATIAGAGLQGAKRIGIEGAVQGGIFGAGQAISEAALAPGGNYDDLASKMIAGGAGGGAFGLVTGGMLGFAGGAGLKAAERGAEKLVGPGGLKRLMEDVSDSAMGRALGMPRAPFGPQAGTEGRIKAMVQAVKKAQLDDGSMVARIGDSQEVLAGRVAQAEKQYAKRIGTIVDEVDDAIESASAKAGYREGADSLRPDLSKFFSKVDSLVAEAETGPAALAGQMRRAAKQVDKLRSSYLAGEATLGDVIKYRRKIDKLVFPEKAGSGVTVAKANAAELQAIRGELEDAIEATVMRAEPLVPGASARYTEAKEMFGALKDARKISSAEIRRGMGRNRMSPAETAAAGLGTLGSLVTGNVLPIAGGMAIGFARNQFRARGEQALAIIADRVAKSDMKLNAAVSRYFKRAGDVRRGTIGAFSAQEDKKSRQERALRQKKNESKADAYQRTLTRISRYNPESDPDMPALASAAPQTAIATAARQARARAYLIAKAPTDVIGDDPLQPQLKKQLADPVKLEHWSRRLEAVEDPVGVIQRGLDHGTLTREHVETIKHVDPQLFESLKAKVMDQLATSKEKLPYQQRVRLGLLLGIPTDKSLRPDQVARTQMMFQKLRAQQPQQKPAPSPSPAQPGVSPYASEAQRLEANIPPQ